jgi:hypothetical protein
MLVHEAHARAPYPRMCPDLGGHERCIWRPPEDRDLNMSCIDASRDVNYNLREKLGSKLFFFGKVMARVAN